MDGTDLDLATREQLIEHAERLGVTRAELLTRVELKDEILRRSVRDEPERKKLRGWLGVARDLLASVVEQGLHLPDAAALIRGDLRVTDPVPARPVATVTLAEIYATQGHVDRAIRMLDEVLAKEPDHQAARNLRQRLAAEQRAEQPAVRDEGKDGGKNGALRASEPFAALLRADRRALLYWELAGDGRTPAQAGFRVLVAVPHWDGADKYEQSLAVAGTSGVTELEDVPAQAVVRAALGIESGERFVPLAVAVELAPDGAVAWQPPAVRPEDAARVLARERAARALVDRAGRG